MAYVARKAMKLKQKKKRLLVYCSHSLTQAVVCALLVHVGVETLQIRRQHTQEQRDEALALFTDPTSNVEYVVTSMALDTVGIHDYVWDGPSKCRCLLWYSLMPGLDVLGDVK
ncbi:hypothetical protein V8C34DRAFT_126497 [Trichoderma compactum]